MRIIKNKISKATQPRHKLRKAVIKELRRENLIEKLAETFPAPVRFFHWGFAISLTAIILTGYILHQPLPFLALPYGKVFEVHVSSGWLASALFVFRLVDMFIRKDTSLLPSAQEIKSFRGLFAYYLFFRPELPHHGHYNIGQKIIFGSWFLLFPFLVFISLASYWAGEHLDWVVKLLGGIQVLRMIKYTGAIYLTSTILLHIYLGITEDLSRLQAMVGGYEQKPPKQ